MDRKEEGRWEMLITRVVSGGRRKNKTTTISDDGREEKKQLIKLPCDQKKK